MELGLEIHYTGLASTLLSLSHKYGSKILRLVKNLAVSRSMTWLSI